MEPVTLPSEPPAARVDLGAADAEQDASAQWMAQARLLVLQALEDARSQ